MTKRRTPDLDGRWGWHPLRHYGSFVMRVRSSPRVAAAFQIGARTEARRDKYGYRVCA